MYLHSYSNIKQTDQVWAGYSDELTEGIYLSPSRLNINSTSLFWKWGEPNGRLLEQCGSLKSMNLTIMEDNSCPRVQYTTCTIRKLNSFNSFPQSAGSNKKPANPYFNTRREFFCLLKALLG